jgi:hypothetical protein
VIAFDAKNLSSSRSYGEVTTTSAAHPDRNHHKEHTMNTTHHLKKIVLGTLLSGAVATAGLGLTAGTAAAQPQGPGVGVDYSDVGPLVTCNACQVAKPGDGSVRVNPGPGVTKTGDGSVRVAVPSAGH